MAKKAPTLNKVIETVSLLHGGKKIAPSAVERVGAHMGNWQTVNTYMVSLPTSEAGMASLRAMLAHELARDGGPRDMIVYRIVARHEQISKNLRFAAMSKALPIISSGLRRTAVA